MVMQALIFIFKSDMIYPMESMEDNKKRMGRPSPWDESLDKVCQSGTQFPKKVWGLIRKPETKITLNEMALNKKFEEQIQRMGAKQKAKRLKRKDEKTPTD
jgi:hypothetical protein